MRHTFMVDGNDNGSCPSLGFCEFDGGGSLRPQHGLALMQLDHRSVEGCLLTGKLIVVMSCPQLGIDLLGAGSHLLLLLVSLLLIGEELHSWLGYRHPHHDC
jgi:hypothetical protein